MGLLLTAMVSLACSHTVKQDTLITPTVTTDTLLKPTITVKPTPTVQMPTPTTTPEVEQSTNPAIEQFYSIGDTVAQIREWDNVPREKVQYSSYTRAELREFIKKQFSTDSALVYFNSIEGVYKTFGLLEPPRSLMQVYNELFGRSVQGFYDTSSESFAVVREEGQEIWSTENYVTFAHEYMHLLQDYHFDLDTLLPDDVSIDYGSAIRALVEGDAVILERAYREEITKRNITTTTSYRSQINQHQLPSIVLFIEFWPYMFGYKFVDNLITQGEGYDLVNKAYETPPVSTEQVIIVEKYIEGETPVTLSIPQDVLGKEWQVIEQDTLGYLYLSAIFAFTDKKNAYSLLGTTDDIVLGWNGDTVIMSNNEAGEFAMAGIIAWDKNSDADEFITGFTSIMNRSAEFEKLQEQNGYLLWQGPIGTIGIDIFEDEKYGKLVIYASSPNKQHVLNTISKLKIPQ